MEIMDPAQTALYQAASEDRQEESQELILSLFQIRFLMHAATPMADTVPQDSFRQLKIWAENEQLRRGRTPMPLTGRVANQILQIKELERMKLIQPLDLGRGRQAWQLTTYGKLMVIQNLYIAESYQQLIPL